MIMRSSEITGGLLSAQTHQRAQSLPHSTLKGARLGKHSPPVGGDFQEGRQEC